MDFPEFNVSSALEVTGSSLQDRMLTSATTKTSDSTNTNPIPLWGSVLIAIGGGIFLVGCIVYACKLCCKKKHTTSQQQYFNFKDIKAEDLWVSDKVQPDLEDLHIKQNYGKLHFTLDYDTYSEELEVVVVQASNLHETHLSMLTNPFVKVYISPDLKTIHETDVHRMTVNPVINETFHFKLPYTTRDTKTLVFCIYHDQLMGKPEKMGEVRAPLGSYDFLKHVDEWRAIDEPGPDEKDTNIGDICLSIRYVPTAGKLSVVVLEAKNLKEIDKEPKNYYVKLLLVCNKKRLRKRKTSTKTSTINPYYNETFTFDATFEVMQKAFLSVKVAVRSRLGKSIAIGCVELGLDVKESELARNHWNEILANIGRPIVHWHALLPVDVD